MAFLCKYFIYNGYTSNDKGVIVCSFDDSPMTESETQLSMTPLYSETISSAYRIDYGAKYNSVLSPSCIIIQKAFDETVMQEDEEVTIHHPDGYPFSFERKREILRWLTGKRDLDWLQIKRIDDEDFIPDEGETYSDDPNLINVLCRVVDISEYKVGNETVGFNVMWAANSPFAYSPLITDVYSLPLDGGASSITISNDGDEAYSNIYPVVTFDNLSSVAADISLTATNDDNREFSISNIASFNSAYVDNLNQIAMKGSNVNPQTYPLGDSFGLTWLRIIPGVNVFSLTFNKHGGELDAGDTLEGTLTIKYRVPLKVGEL